jgi:hypothetical protein
MPQVATVRALETDPAVCSREALFYGLSQLAQRAGVDDDLFRSWRCEIEASGAITVFVGAGTSKKLTFPAVPEAVSLKILSGECNIARATWMSPAPSEIAKEIPNFVVPYARAEKSETSPLFTPSDVDSIACAENLPLATVLMLSRFEETLPSRRDIHGRFRTLASMAWIGGFQERAVVDEWGFAFAQALQALLPSWTPTRPKFRVMLGHDVDEIGLPFNFRSAIAHTLRRATPSATIRDLASPFLGIDTTYLRLLREIVALSVKYRLRSTVYWKCSVKGPHDTGYDLRHRRLRAACKQFRQQGMLLGVHPGYETYLDRDRFCAEIRLITETLGTRNVGGRQDFLRWDPSTWAWWESEGLLYDASVGYPDWIGFRAGTCHPYHPWLLKENRQARLLEIPVVAMDSALRGYMRLPAGEALSRLRALLRKCRVLGGVFTLVWHSTTMMDPTYAEAYRSLVKEIAGTPGFDPMKTHSKN